MSASDLVYLYISGRWLRCNNLKIKICQKIIFVSTHKSVQIVCKYKIKTIINFAISHTDLHHQYKCCK